MDKRCQPQTSYGHGGSCILKGTSNYIFYPVAGSSWWDLTKLVQDFVNSPTQISRFLGLGEPYRQTVPATDQLWTWGFLHIQEDVKLHILSGGGINPGGSWLFDAGDWKFPYTNFEILGCWGKFLDPRCHPQARYANGDWCILKSMSNCILGQLVDFF